METFMYRDVSFLIFQICNELQECHATIDSFLHNNDAVTKFDIEELVSKEDSISIKLQELKQQQRQQDEDILASLNEAIIITEQSLNAVQRKMYGELVDLSALHSPSSKVRFIVMTLLLLMEILDQESLSSGHKK